MIYVILAFACGFVLGAFVLARLVLKKYLKGDLVVKASSQSDEPYLFVELYEGADKVYAQKYVLFKVRK